jgi:hypothetical protein
MRRAYCYVQCFFSQPHSFEAVDSGRQATVASFRTLHSVVSDDTLPYYLSIWLSAIGQK